MASRQDPRNPRPPGHEDLRHDAARERHGHDRGYERGQDMGGSTWSGASGRGGMSYEHEQGRSPREGGYSREAGYPREGGYPRTEGGWHQGGYSREGEYSGGSGYARPREDYPRSEGADNEGGFPRESGFPIERGYGHIPGQRWSGGYGGDVVRRGPHDRETLGSGFAGSDFGPTLDQRGSRHFGNDVDRGGRMSGGLGVGAPPEDRGPHYGKGPKGYKRSDERVREDVCDEIAHQGFIDASDVEVTVEGGAVTLTGTVARRQEKRALEHLVERCRGVQEVHNHLRLKREEARTASAHQPAETSERASLVKEASKATPDSARNGKSHRA